MSQKFHFSHIVALFITVFFSGGVFSQVIFSEPFDEAIGSTSGLDNTGGVAWSAVCPACVVGDYYNVQAGRLEGLDTNGPATWTTGSIDISSCDFVAVNFTLTEQGVLEACNTGCTSVDWVSFEYNIDGTGWQSPSNSFFCAGACAGLNVIQADDILPDGSALNYASGCIGGGSTLQLRIAVQSWAATEFWQIDDVTVSCIASGNPTITPAGPFCISDPAVALSAVDPGGTWVGPGTSVGGIFDPAVAGIGSHEISYTLGAAPCDTTDTVTIVVVATPTATISANNGPICSGNDAIFTITGTADAIVIYNINGAPSTTTTLTGGTSTITVTGALVNQTLTLVSADLGSCSSVLNEVVTITIAPPPTATISANNGPICSGDNAIFTITGTSGAIVTYNINGAPSATTTLTGGTSNITVTGATVNQTMTLVLVSLGSCSAVLSQAVTITVNPLPTATISANNGPICSGSNAIFTITGTSGAVVTYNINGAPSTTTTLTGGTSNITVVSPVVNQTLTLELVDNGTCSDVLSQAVTINIITAPTATISANNGPICSGQNAIFTITGTSGSIVTYNINGAPSTTTTLMGGTSNVTVVGATANQTMTLQLVELGACSAVLSQSVTITVNPLPTASITANNGPICSGDNAIFTITGTSGAVVTYSINGAPSATTTLTGGTSNVTVTGATVNQTLTLQLVDNGTCTNVLSQAVTITVNPLPTASITANNGPICTGSNAIFTITGTSGAVVTYNINGAPSATTTLTGGTSNITVVSPVVNQTLTLELVDNGTCSDVLSQTVTINIITAPTATISSNNGPICSGQNAIFTITGTSGSIVTYNINGAPSTTTTLTGGTSNVTVLGATVNQTMTLQLVELGTCSAVLSQSVTITVNPLPTASITANNGPICFGDNAIFTITGTSGALVTYSVNGAPSATTTLTGGTSNVTITGATTNQTMTLQSVDLGSCSNVLSQAVTITVNPLPTATISANNGPICSGQNAIFTITGTSGAIVTYNINGAPSATTTLTGGTSNITVTSPGVNQTLTLELVDNGSCNDVLSQTVTIAIITAPTAIISANNGPICSGDNAIFTITGTAGAIVTYDINGAPSATTTLTGGTSNVTVTGATTNQTLTLTLVELGSCSAVLSQSMTITVNPLPTATISATSGPICSGGDAIFTITGTPGATVTYTINGAPSTTTILVGGTSTVTVPGATSDVTLTLVSVDDGTCQATLSQTSTVLVNPLPFASSITGGGDYCQGDVVGDILVDGAWVGVVVIDYTLDGVPQSASGTLAPINLGNQPGVYVLTGISDLNCSNTVVGTQTINIIALPPAPMAGTDSTYCAGDVVEPMTVSGTGGTYSWYSDASLNNFEANGSTFAPLISQGAATYYVTETVNGCEGPADAVTIIIDQCDITVPTAFTPNLDGANDTWELIGIDNAYPDNVVRVYNRWGNLIFEHKSENGMNPYADNPWDGTFKGSALPVATYYYIIEYSSDEGDGSQNGSVSIILD